MSDNTARLAREWAERKKAQAKRHMEDAGYFPREDTMAAIEQILATTSPLTMADVEWDDKEHYLSGAVDSDGIEVVMMGWRGLLILVSDVDQVNISYAPVLEDPKDLTPNGKRYELREIGAQEEPARPETLVTEQDYANAPAGTVVAESHYFAWQKNQFGAWRKVKTRLTDREMAGTERQVLRWGWGK